jgi:2-polyprenyl-3-methyl-5-hydroxy-6-metoxy-1,4-benzoquinol methylase
MFDKRSDLKEFLDKENLPVDDLYRNLQELDVINKYLGGYRISTNALANILKSDMQYTLVDIGSGGGDTLRYVHLWAMHKNYDLTCCGIDLKGDCIIYSKEKHSSFPLIFIQDDYRNVSLHIDKIDIIHASLFCHHLSNEQIIDLINFCLDKGAHLVVNDLHRNPIAYYSIKWLTALFSKSYLVKNDAPLSVLRGFSKPEWLDLLSKSKAKNYTVKWKWAFRHQIIVYPNEK